MKLYNSLTRSKDELKPLRPDEISMYVCGITPYDTTHLGHAFTYTTFDILYRYLTYQKYKVIYTQNVTDIDDDILKRANQLNQDWKELGIFWTDKFARDMKTLNNTPPTHFVKATETMKTITQLIKKLLADGFAYEVDGNVYFRIEKFPDYGQLSGYTRREMIQLSRQRGANPDDPKKENKLDFIMWQKSLKGEPYWESPFGQGRPGWHIECSAMVYKYLYNNIDIHGGGIDLIYPHHESEIAQSETFTGEKPFSQFWLHTGPVRYEGDKMSKSLGNLVMISDLLKAYSPDAIRLMLLRHHYRKSWEYHEDELIDAQKIMHKILQIMKEKPTQQGTERTDVTKLFEAALDDDLDTPKAIKIFLTLVYEQGEKPTFQNEEAILKMADVLGFFLE